MGWYRATVDLEYKGQGKSMKAKAGQLVDILTAAERDMLMMQGKIVERNQSHKGKLQGAPTPPRARTRRIGLWLYNSLFHSGGRIHLYQIAHCLAKNGCEVFFISNTVPKWKADYDDANITFIQEGGVLPKDLDVILTDSKKLQGRKALDYKQGHPWTKFVCMNFEDPDWVKEYDDEYAKVLEAPKNILWEADMFLTNSAESYRRLDLWLKKAMSDTAHHVVHPAVNTYAIEKSLEAEITPVTTRPYAVWVARGVAYKGAELARKAIEALPLPFDLVAIGNVPGGAKRGTDHNVYELSGISDVHKFKLMQNAEFVLAPSKFEAYGMVPQEALSVSTPVIVYDLPVLRQEYGDIPGMHYVPLNDFEIFFKKVLELATKEKQKLHDVKIRTERGLDAMRKTIDRVPYFRNKKPSVTAHLSTYWGFLPESIESIYKDVDQIIVTHGRVTHAQEIDDGTLNRLKAVSDPDSKIRMEIRDTWDSKLAMRQWAADRVEGNHLLILDGDEVWDGLDFWLESPTRSFSTPAWANFWHDEKHWIHDDGVHDGRRWGMRLGPGCSVCPHPRIFWWRPSYRFVKHHLIPCDQGSFDVHDRDLTGSHAQPKTTIYHFGHMLPRAIMQKKHDFYLARDGNDAGRQLRRDTWHNWNGEIGQIKDGHVERVDFTVPRIVQRAIERVRAMKVAD